MPRWYWLLYVGLFLCFFFEVSKIGKMLWRVRIPVGLIAVAVVVVLAV